ncbi:MAG: branched-chain amino acid ABC transporter permease [Haloferacaceae archaeon]
MVQTGLFNAVVTGIVTGSVVALGAIGLSLVYSIAEVPNFAHGELLMLGAYAALLVNKPGTVPVFELLATNTQAAAVPGLVVLFALSAGATLGTVYLLDGREALAGSWWPVAVPDAAGYAGHAALAAAVGALVVVSTPSVVGGMLFAALLLSALAPLQERVVFGRFREKGVDLATMLIVALGLSFVLRFGTQALFGGQVRSYTVPDIATVAGVEIPLSAAQRFDFFVVAARGVVVRIINTGTAGTEPTTVAVVTYGWARLAAILLVTVAVAYGAYRWRSRATGGTVLGPRVAAAGSGVVTLAVLALALPTGASTPDAAAYSTRVSLSLTRGLTVLIAAVMMTLLHVLLRGTKLGKAMRASSDNLDLAKVTGIDTDKVMMATWVIAGAYAAIGGVMLGVLFASITPNIGFFLLLPMFAGVILGGIGSVYGAIVGSYFVGLSMDVGIYLFNIETTYRIPIAFVVLFVVLLVKPEGIVGGN